MNNIKVIGAQLVNSKTSFFVAKYMSILTQEFEIVGNSISCMSSCSFISVYYRKSGSEIQLV